MESCCQGQHAVSGYTREALIRIFERAFHMSKRLVEATAVLVEAVLSAILALVASICRLFGIRPPESRQALPVPTTTPDDVTEEYRDQYTREVANDHACASDIGMVVFQYAS
jgi:hypothetical protein